MQARAIGVFRALRIHVPKMRSIPARMICMCCSKYVYVAEVDLYRLGSGTRDLQLCLVLEQLVTKAAPSAERKYSAALLAEIMAIPVGAADLWAAAKVANSVMSDAVFDAVDTLN